MTARRVLSVWIDSTAIEAGDVSPPQVDSVLRFPMHFTEHTSLGEGVVAIHANLAWIRGLTAVFPSVAKVKVPSELR